MRRPHFYTLIEMLAALGIFVLAAAAVTASAGGGLRVLARARYYSELQTDLYLSLMRLERDLHNVFAFTGIGLTGADNRLAIPGIVNVWQAGPDGKLLTAPGKILYYVDNADNALICERRFYANAADKLQDAIGERTVLCRSIAGLRLRYYSYDTDSKRFGWRQNWAPEDGLPLAVQVQVELLGNDDSTKKISRTIFIPVARNLP